MVEISVSLIEKAIYDLCYQANIFLPHEVFKRIQDSAKSDKKNEYILKNAQIAAQNKRPLCQDTGQVIVFLRVGQDVHFTGGDLSEAINQGVKRCYIENYFRKSVVKDALFERENTGDNTPCSIHYDFIQGDAVEIDVMIKGGGSENVTGAKMLNPTTSKEEFYQEILEIVDNACKNACPPVFIGIGVSKTLDDAVLTSKKAIISGKNDAELLNFLNKNINIGLNKPVLDVKLLSAATHIASMPLGVTVLCHSNRFNSCVIKNNDVIFKTQFATPSDFDINENCKEIRTCDIERLKNLQAGERFLLTGKIYTARDAAHKRLVEMIKNGEKLPFDIKNSILFYAGPCPAKPDEISGPIGPTTAKRMDKFAVELYEAGVFATIAKGIRTERVMTYLKNSQKKYFEVQGGIASYLAHCVTSSEIVAFEDLGAEAIFELNVERFPMVCV